jgi:uncharacterized lipoprotein YbaY
VTGTLTYREPHELSAEAIAAVALVRGSALPSEDTIVATEVYDSIGQVPVGFELEFDPADIDPTERYTIQATIIDGDDAWVTTTGVEVLTDGAPSDVDITLSFRPDVLKGQVSGQVTAVGLTPAVDAYAITVLVAVDTGDTLGIQVQDSNGTMPIPFAIPFGVRAIVPSADYVVYAAIEDGTDTSWENTAGVPVITKGNPKSDVQVVVSEVVPLVPLPTPTAAPTAAPVVDTDPGRGTSLLLNLILIGAVVAIAAAVIVRLRQTA